MPRRTSPLGPPPRRKAQPPEAQRTTPRHKFLAGVDAGHFAIRFRYGGDSLLILTPKGQQATGRHHPDRGEQAAYRWAGNNSGAGHRLLGRNANFDRDQTYYLHESGKAILRQWNETYGDPLTPKTGQEQDK